MSQDEILAHIGRLALSGALPAEGEARVSALLDAGFDPREVRSALGLPPDPAAPDGRRDEVPVVNLSESASSFLVGLRDLGYLTADMEDETLDLLLDEVSPDAVVDLPAVRRAVASVLFERGNELDPETLKFLDEEWRLAFH